MSATKEAIAEKMENQPMGRLIVSMSLPLMFSLLVQSLYNIVDSIFVARISENALTATSLAYPIQILMIAVAVGTSVGVNSLLSRTIGAKKFDKAGYIATTGLLLAIISSFVFIILGALFSKNFVALFTDDPEISVYCQQYVFICMIFCTGTFVETMCQRFVQAVGSTYLSMISLVVGAGTNIVLDPIMIFGLFGFPQLGIRGAAIATVIGQWIGAFVALTIHIKKNPTVKLRFKGFRFDSNIVAGIYKVGIPMAITQAIGSMMVLAFNSILMPFSSTAVAFFGVYYKLQNFLFMPMNGLGQAAIPIIGYNFGNRNGKRIRDALKMMLPMGAGIAIIGTIIFMIFPAQLLGLFNASDEMLAIGVPALRIISVTFVLSATTIILGYACSGLGNGMTNMIGTALRQFIIFVPLAYFFAKINGISSIWYSIWVAEAVGVCYVICSSLREYRRKVKPMFKN
ncbi:MAG: MATE family efflux transporter [Clostridiales bacterium]|nr:MATE family efflux transporter [Clostridiales bacterium]